MPSFHVEQTQRCQTRRKIRDHINQNSEKGSQYETTGKEEENALQSTSLTRRYTFYSTRHDAITMLQYHSDKKAPYYS